MATIEGEFSKLSIRNFVGGKFYCTQGTIEKRAPATGKLLYQIPRSSASDVSNAVDCASHALQDPKWSKMPTEKRASLLEEIARRIEDRMTLFAHTETMDTGKPIQLSSSLDIPRAISNFRFFAGALRHDHTECHAMDDAINYTQRSPLGVVGLITPWNLPLYLLSWKLAPALAMGNTVVAKVSELTPGTATLLAEIFEELETEKRIPHGVFNLVHGLGSEAGAALVANDKVSAISFTGGTATGSLVGAAAGRSFKKCSLELGGKNPSIVFADCDMERAVTGVLRSSFLNQGQICLCSSRILIEGKIFTEFTERLLEEVKKLQIGDPAETTTNFGAVISEEHRRKIVGWIEKARSSGAEIRWGGIPSAEVLGNLPEKNRAGYFVPPTIITGAEHDSPIAQEEIFGPVVTLHPFENADDAVSLANGTPYGLAATIWTSDLQKAHSVAHSLQTGMVWVNTWLHRDLRVPFGGVKQSGVGREGGSRSLEFFSEAKNICIHLGGRPK